MRVSIHNLANDVEFFNKIGKKLRRLKWFQCHLSCSQRQTTQNTSNQSDEGAHSPLPLSLKLNQFAMSSMCPAEYEHRHVNLVRGLSGLSGLRVLSLSETDYFDVEDRCTILDDESMQEIFRSCGQLEMLTISCAIRRNKRNYHQYEFDSKENCRDVNPLLSRIFRENGTSLEDGLMERPSMVAQPGMKSAFHRSESIFGAMFECESDEYEEHSLDSGISDSHHPHTVSDACLASLDTHLPKLRILQLRGVRLGLKSMEAISRLRLLEYLRLDAITFEPLAKEYFSEFIGKMALSNLMSKTNIRITNIPLL